MSKVKNKEKIVQASGGDYISIKTFQDHISRSKSPYSTSFSFRPFFNGLRRDDAFNTFEHWNLNGNLGVLSDGSQSVTFSTANSVPEPSSTAVLVGLGIASTVRRRRRVASPEIASVKFDLV